MMMNDDDFAQHLRARLDDVAPPVTVHTAHVVPRARRRRARIRSLQAVGAVGALAVVGAAADGLSGWAAPWQGSDVAPATTTTPDPAPTADATAAPQETPVATDDTGEPGPLEEEAIASGRYWYSRTVSTWGSETEVDELWRSTTEPGLIVADGDLTTPAAMGPVDVVGRFNIDGQWHDMLRDPALLPTDGEQLAAVLRASVEPDRRQGTDDDKVFEMAQELLRRGLLLPEPLLHAAWAAAADVAGAAIVDGGVPGRTVTVGTDSAGRLGEVVEYLGSTGTVRLIRDPQTGLLLEEVDDQTSTRYEVQEFTDEIPLEPTLEIAGCVAWETC